jgi:hypothetical protein
MGKDVPLANINFCTYSEQQVLTPITTVEVFKPSEGKKGVCTSFKEWALCIIKPNQEFQLRGLHDDDDDETKEHLTRVTSNTVHGTFSISDKDFTMASNGSDSKNKDVNLWI